jgi:hypothetical protein
MSAQEQRDTNPAVAGKGLWTGAQIAGAQKLDKDLAAFKCVMEGKNA